MTKKDEINKYLSENDAKDKEKLIKELSKTFNIAETSATTFYYRWKRQFMKSENCVPKKEKKVEKVKPKEKQEIKVSHDIKAIETSKEQVSKKSNLRIKSGIIEGKYVDYEIVDGTVKVGQEVFKDEDDLDRYRKEQLQQFYAQIGEIQEVLDMIS